LGQQEETGYKMINFMKNAMRSLTREYPNIILNAVKNENVAVPGHWELSDKHENDVKNIIKNYYNDFNVFYKDQQIQLLMKKMMVLTSDLNELAQNTLFYAPVELKTKHGENKSGENKSGENKSGENKSADANPKEPSFKYSAFDLRLTTLLFNFYFLSVLTDLISLQEDKEILTRHMKPIYWPVIKQNSRTK
jgi:hypothetical protein